MVDSRMLKEGQTFRELKDFHQSDSRNMHYATLAKGMKHFKETEEHDNMSEAVERYAKEYAKEYVKECVEQEKLKVNTNFVKNLMENLKFTLEQALNALGIQGEERERIKGQVQKDREHSKSHRSEI